MQEFISRMQPPQFTPDVLLKALAIINIFETGKPFGEFSACVVLNDGAGISYGISQFTHRSGSLLEVLERYLANGGQLGRGVIEVSLPQLRQNAPRVISATAGNDTLKKALRAAAVSREMREAQLHVTFSRYLKPAIEACAGSRFVLPLSLAVIYDSITHGSFEKIRARVHGTPKAVTLTDEKAWVTEYVRQRDKWLASIPRLNSTRYRTRFFLDLIKLGRWDLPLPLNVNGFRLDARHIENIKAYADDQLVLAHGPETSSHQPGTPNSASVPANPSVRSPHVSKGSSWGSDHFRAADTLTRVSNRIQTTAENFDAIDEAISTIATRTDRAKALWTTIGGTIWQTLWAVFGFIAGIPREVWLVVAIIAAVLMLAYLYRQITLGKIRETK